jgi:hypothetical protein
MKFYRYEAVVYAEHDHDGELVSPIFRNPKIELRRFDLIQETPKGYWIGSFLNGWDETPYFKKWVTKTSKKRYAYPTKAEALQNYIKRTEKRIKILKSQLQECQSGLSKAKAMTMFSQKFDAGDEVKLPFKEKGEVIEFIDLPWGSRYNVRITDSNGFNEVGEIVDFFEKDLELI